MNDLQVVTAPTEDKTVFDVYWMTGLVKRGRVRITVPSLEDSATAAELSAIRYLLEEKNVCGHNKAGLGLRLKISRSTILDLLHAEAPKGYLSPYANFLRTRFLGAEVQVCDGPFEWADGSCEANVDFVEVHKPTMTIIDVCGIGPVEVTAHAVERYVERFERPPQKAWRDLRAIAQDVYPVKILGRGVLTEIKHRRPGQHLLNDKRQVMLVVAQPDRMEGLPRLVSVQRASLFAERVAEPG